MRSWRRSARARRPPSCSTAPTAVRRRDGHEPDTEQHAADNRHGGGRHTTNAAVLLLAHLRCLASRGRLSRPGTAAPGEPLDLSARARRRRPACRPGRAVADQRGPDAARRRRGDRKSTRLNSSHRCISYAVFCLKKKIHTKPASSLLSDALYKPIFTSIPSNQTTPDSESPTSLFNTLYPDMALCSGFGCHRYSTY